MGRTNASSFTPDALTLSAPGFPHPGTGTADAETASAVQRFSDLGEKGIPGWESAWIDLGGEG